MPEDTVYNLGDFSFAQDTSRWSAFCRVWRTTSLDFGNHDHVIRQHADFSATKPSMMGIRCCRPYGRIWLKSPEVKYWFSFYPIQEWDGCYPRGWYRHARPFA